MSMPRAFLCYLPEDRPWADRCSKLLEGFGASISSGESAPGTAEEVDSRLREAIQQSSHSLILIGPRTRLSKAVDRTIELSIEAAEDGPGPVIIGVVLPVHGDYSQRYYEPENIPLRLHDLIQNDYAILHKWTEDPAELRRWLDEAERRGRSRRPQISFAAAAQLYRFDWDAKVDFPDV